jgi:hypothetical protein
MKPNYEIIKMVDRAMDEARKNYMQWFDSQVELWGDDNFLAFVSTCKGFGFTANVFTGTGEECSKIYKDLDKELYKRGILLWYEAKFIAVGFGIDSLTGPSPTFKPDKNYSIWLAYAGKGKWQYGINIAK